MLALCIACPARHFILRSAIHIFLARSEGVGGFTYKGMEGRGHGNERSTFLFYGAQQRHLGAEKTSPAPLTKDGPGSAASERENTHLQACLCCRGLADRSCPCGRSRNRPRAGPHAHHGPQGHHAPERHADGAEADHAG